MKIANYTTEVPTEKSVMEITAMLAAFKAERILTDYENGMPVTISFQITRNGRRMGFRLPSDWRRTLKVICADRSIQPRFKTSQQAQRVAWRIIRDWLRAQLSLIEIDAADVEQVLLPYAVTPSGETLYERVKSENFAQLALPESTGA